MPTAPTLALSALESALSDPDKAPAETSDATAVATPAPTPATPSDAARVGSETVLTPGVTSAPPVERQGEARDLVAVMRRRVGRWRAFAVLMTLLVVAVAALLAAWELRAARPFIDLRLLASARALTRTYLRFGLTLLGVYVVLYGITQWMEAARGLSPEQAGLVLLPMGAVAALVSHPVSRRNLVRGPLIACAFFMLLASVATLFITGHSPVIALVGVIVLFGVVVGTMSVGNQTALYLQSPPESLGTASGLSRTFGYIGSIGSATITSIVFHARVSDAGLHDMALILVGVAAVVLLLTLLDRQLPGGSKT